MQDGISANGRNYNRHYDTLTLRHVECEAVSTRHLQYEEESIVAFSDRGERIYTECRLVVQRNPPEFFDLVGEVLAVEEMNHPVAALVTALQQEELTPLLVVQLNNVKRGCGGTEISETNS